MAKAQTTPGDIFRRLTLISAMNGWSIALLSGVFALLSIMWGDVFGSIIGLTVTSCGAMEVYGLRQLHARKIDGLTFMIRAQYALVAVVGIYAAVQIQTFNPTSIVSPEMQAAMAEASMKLSDIISESTLRNLNTLSYCLIFLFTAGYQLGLATYYRRRRGPVATFLAPPPILEEKGWEGWA